MSEEDKNIINIFLNKKEEILEFREIKAIVKLLLEVNNKIDELLPKNYTCKIDLKGLEKRNNENTKDYK